MRKRNRMGLVLLLSCLSWTTPALALVTFPRGTCQLEGYLRQGVMPGIWLLIVNDGTDSETRFRLSAGEGKLKNRISGERIRATVQIPEVTESHYAEAVLISIDTALNPYSELKNYYSARDLKAICKSAVSSSAK